MTTGTKLLLGTLTSCLLLGVGFLLAKTLLDLPAQGPAALTDGEPTTSDAHIKELTQRLQRVEEELEALRRSTRTSIRIVSGSTPLKITRGHQEMIELLQRYGAHEQRVAPLKP